MYLSMSYPSNKLELSPIDLEEKLCGTNYVEASAAIIAEAISNRPKCHLEWNIHGSSGIGKSSEIPKKAHRKLRCSSIGSC